MIELCDPFVSIGMIAMTLSVIRKVHEIIELSVVWFMKYSNVAAH